MKSTFFLRYPVRSGAGGSAHRAEELELLVAELVPRADLVPDVGEVRLVPSLAIRSSIDFSWTAWSAVDRSPSFAVAGSNADTIGSIAVRYLASPSAQAGGSAAPSPVASDCASDGGAAVSPGALDPEVADGALDTVAGPSVAAVPGDPLHPMSASTVTRTDKFSLRIVDLPQSDPRDVDAPRRVCDDGNRRSCRSRRRSDVPPEFSPAGPARPGSPAGSPRACSRSLRSRCWRSPRCGTAGCRGPSAARRTARTATDRTPR